MKTHLNFLRAPLAIAAFCIFLTGCTGWWTIHRADSLIEQGDAAGGIHLYEKLARAKPRQHLAPYVAVRDREIRRLLADAESARRTRNHARALEAYRSILAFDPRQPEALYGLDRMARDERHTTLLRMARDAIAAGDMPAAQQALGEVLVEEPEHSEAKTLRQQLQVDANRELINAPRLKDALRKKVSLEFRDASVSAIFEILAQTSGINFIFDRDLRADGRTTIFTRDSTVEDALRLILETNQLGMKVLNETTVMIYPATGEKAKRYEELVTRSFYLGSADPARVMELVKTMATPKSIWADEKLRMLVVRDRLEVIDTIERLIAAYDIPSPEVLLDVQVLEVSSDDLLNLGLQAPDSISASVYGAANKAGELTLNELEDLDRSSFKVFLPDPLAVLNLQQTSGKSNTLANPRIRVKSLGKAKILIGDKVPVITTTTTTNSTAESVSYLDVGLKLQAEPEVHANNDISITLELEVSNIVKEVKTSSGLLTYQIGTRNASTSLRLRDGETQVLAGLIRDDERSSASHVPGIGKLPIIGRLFSSRNDTHSKSEIVLLITPHVLRSLHKPAADVVEFVSGTEDNVSTKPLRLTPAASYSAKKLKPLPAVPTPEPSTAPADNKAPAESSSTPAPIVPPVNPVPLTETAPTVDTTVETITVAPADTRLDPGLAHIRLDMIAPAQIRAGQEFTLAIMANGRSAEVLTFDIHVTPNLLTLVRAVPINTPAGFTAEPTTDGLRITAQSVAANGPLAMLTLKANAAQETPLVIRMENAEAKRAGDMGLLVSAALPREIRVTP